MLSLQWLVQLGLQENKYKKIGDELLTLCLALIDHYLLHLTHDYNIFDDVGILCGYQD